MEVTGPTLKGGCMWPPGASVGISGPPHPDSQSRPHPLTPQDCREPRGHASDKGTISRDWKCPPAELPYLLPHGSS